MKLIASTNDTKTIEMSRRDLSDIMAILEAYRIDYPAGLDDQLTEMSRDRLEALCERIYALPHK